MGSSEFERVASCKAIFNIHTALNILTNHACKRGQSKKKRVEWVRERERAYTGDILAQLYKLGNTKSIIINYYYYYPIYWTYANRFKFDAISFGLCECVCVCTIMRNHFLQNGFLNRFHMHTLSVCAEVKLMCLSYVFHSFLRSFNMLPHRFIFCCLFVWNFINWYTFNAFICETVYTYKYDVLWLLPSVFIRFDSIQKSYLQWKKEREEEN